MTAAGAVPRASSCLWMGHLSTPTSPSHLQNPPLSTRPEQIRDSAITTASTRICIIFVAFPPAIF